eukprot:TRINITY_DN5460_c0_g1_i1.p1 TRINITY_DN5460_c0_g1~~TRINITY_DN5460_c0_g1_i1.p1  ORF type:complete len:628 (+),score=132.70 TRINITY_DN5460_c0_g1_i1:144-2027(+)
MIAFLGFVCIATTVAQGDLQGPVVARSLVQSGKSRLQPRRRGQVASTKKSQTVQKVAEGGLQGPVVAPSLLQSGKSRLQPRRRDQVASSTKKSQTVEIDVGPKGGFLAKIQQPKEFSDHDDYCAADGLTPGVCALSGLALGSTAVHVTQSERLERALISEISSALRGSHEELTEERLKKTEDEIWPLYSTLPHVGGTSGGLGLPSARYLLHQVFLRKYQWYVRGLNPAGDTHKDASISEALRGHVAGQLLELLGRETGKGGLSLRVLAVFVSMLEHLLHGDERERLKVAWKVHGLKLDDSASQDELISVLEVFVTHYLEQSIESRNGYATASLEQARQQVTTMKKLYDGFDDISSFIYEAVTKRGPSSNLTVAITAAEEVLQRYNKVSTALCSSLRSQLTNLPGGKSGKVPLSQLRIIGAQDLLRETDEYLREVGALDERNPQNVSVLIPNYMNGPSNCDGSTSFYDLCCPNLCEARLAKFEGVVASNPDVDTVRVVADLLAAMTDVDTSEDDLERLRSMSEAAAAQGNAFLHGYAFNKFLHERFPSECPRPRAEDFSYVDGGADVVPDAHAAFQKAALLERWTLTKEEAALEVEKYGGNATKSLRGGIRLEVQVDNAEGDGKELRR